MQVKKLYLIYAVYVQKNLVYDSVLPYTDSIVYPDCKGTGERSFDEGTELLTVLAICRHALVCVMAYMLNVSKSTICRLFVAWVVFLETIFDSLDLKPDEGFLIKKMPEIFLKTGHGPTDLVIDCT